MTKSKKGNKRGGKKKKLLFLIVLAFIYSSSAVGSYFLLKDRFAFESEFISEIESRASANGSDERLVPSRLYNDIRHASSHNSIVMRKDTLLTLAEDVIRQRIKPYRARLLDLYMDKKGVLYIDFGSEIQKNFSGDAYEEMKIIAGLFLGVKQKIPELTALKILIEGREEESIGGHIDISRPIGAKVAERI